MLGFAAGFFLKKALKVILFVAGGIIACAISIGIRKDDSSQIGVQYTHQSNVVAQQALHTMTGALRVQITNAQMTAAGLNRYRHRISYHWASWASYHDLLIEFHI